jgi:predicted membrane chloride channel (bestrophin family)
MWGNGNVFDWQRVFIVYIPASAFYFARVFDSSVMPRFAAFAISLKHRLRGSVNTEEELTELSAALLPETLDLVMCVNNRPGACLRLMHEYFMDKSSLAEFSELLLIPIQGIIAELSTVQYSCERIINTPIPQPYLIQIRQLVFLYGYFSVSVDCDLSVI